MRFGIFARLVLAVTLAFAAIMASASAQTRIKVSYQSLYWALPFYIASEKGFWKEVGLDPEFSIFPAGAQQVAALPSKSWDFGGTGSPPAVLGAARFNLQTIGIANDESAVTVMVARAQDALNIQKNPASLKGGQLLVSTNSTGEYAAVACLKKFGLSASEMAFVNLAPAQLISAYSNGNGTVAATWAPYGYVLQEKAGAVEICNGRDANAIVSASLVVRADYAEEHPAEVARALAVTLRAITWQKAHKAETIEYLRQFYEKAGMVFDRKYLEGDFEKRRMFTLSQQLELFDRKGGASTVDKWNNQLSQYLVSKGTLTAAPDPNSYVTDKFLRMIESDPKLHKFASGD